MKNSLKRIDGKGVYRLFEACFKWLKLLQVEDFHLKVNTKDLNELTDEAFKTQAKSKILTVYKEATITGDEVTITQINDQKLDKLACHEIVHIVTNPLRELLEEVINALPIAKRQPYANWASYEVEGVTTHLTNVVRALHKAPKGK